MIEYFIISIVALIVAALTLFSGFGLGTLLMPAFALFFPIEIAIGATAVVHLANNFFKIILVGGKADFKTVLKFGLPAALFAIFGAWLLNFTSSIEPIMEYSIGQKLCVVEVSKIVIALLMIFFAFFEIIPRLKNITLNKKWTPVGGALSGFFGGYSGHQGALRSAFLVRLGLSKEAFIGTIVVTAVLVDVSRLLVYGTTFFSKHFSALESEGVFSLILTGIVAAFVGSFLGSKLIKKVTMDHVQILVAIMLLFLALGLGFGII